MKNKRDQPVTKLLPITAFVQCLFSARSVIVQ